MSFMFDGATSFDQPIGDWNTANVTTMSDMLNGATSFNQPVGDWNTANVTNMNYMFGNASSFNQSIGDWTLNSSVSMLFMLDNSGMDCENYSTTLMEWAANNPNVQNRSLGAVGRTYGTNAVTARNTLVNDRGWTITGDIAGTGVCGASVTCEATATNNGDNTISASTGVSYQWIDCNNGNAPIAGATAQTFTATQTGSYAVIVTDTDNCESTSACVSITITTVGIENSSLNSLSIYPNPTAGIVTLSNVAVGSEIKILDISGKTIHTLIVSNEVLTVSTQNWNNGVYFVQVMNDNVVLSTKKLVVNK
jgi:surface protein